MFLGDFWVKPAENFHCAVFTLSSDDKKPILLWRFLGLLCYTKRGNNIDVDEVTGIGLKVPYIKKYLVAGGKFGAFTCDKQISYFNFTLDFRNKKIGPTWKIKNLAIFKN